MAKNITLLDFAKNALSKKNADTVKGGRNTIPINTGSYGYINWDDVSIREPGIVVNDDVISWGGIAIKKSI